MSRLGLTFLCFIGLSWSNLVWSISLKDVRQYEAQLSRATGVPSSIYNIRYVVNESLPFLSTTGDIDDFSRDLVLAATRVAAVYCEYFVTNEMQLEPSHRRAHQAIDFSASPSQLGVDALKKVFAQYSQLFWGRHLNIEEEVHLKGAAQSLITTLPNEPQSTKSLMISLCTLAGSSLNSLVNID